VKKALPLALLLAAVRVPALAGEVRGRVLVAEKPAAGVAVAAVPY
jgi:hypothetical protein